VMNRNPYFFPEKSSLALQSFNLSFLLEFH
jgi:hypothetical protein